MLIYKDVYVFYLYVSSYFTISYIFQKWVEHKFNDWFYIMGS